MLNCREKMVEYTVVRISIKSHFVAHSIKEGLFDLRISNLHYF